MCLRYQQKTYALFMFFAVILFFSSFVFADFICQRDICIYETDIQKNISDLKFNISFNIFNNNSNKICFDIGAWVVKLGTNWTENININYSQNKTFKNYNVKISQIPAIEQRNILINVRDCQNHSKKTTLKIPVNLTKIIAKTNIENIYWKHENNKLFANVSIRNYDDDQNVSGDFYIKLEHNKKELDRKEKHIEAEFNKSLNYSFEFNTSEFLGGIYRLYAHYKYNNSYFDTKTSKEDKNVYIDGIGSDLEINCSFKDLKNKNISFNPANISFFINNTGNNSYSINTSIKINDIKTSSGEIDYFILCSSKNLSHKNNISFNLRYHSESNPYWVLNESTGGLVPWGVSGTFRYYFILRNHVTGNISINDSSYNVTGVGYYEHQFGDIDLERTLKIYSIKELRECTRVYSQLLKWYKTEISTNKQLPLESIHFGTDTLGWDAIWATFDNGYSILLGRVRIFGVFNGRSLGPLLALTDRKNSWEFADVYLDLPDASRRNGHALSREHRRPARRDPREGDGIQRVAGVDDF